MNLGRNRVALFLLLLVFSYGLILAIGYDGRGGEEEEEWGRGERGGREWGGEEGETGEREWGGGERERGRGETGKEHEEKERGRGEREWQPGEREERGRGEREGETEGGFLLQQSKQVIKTDAGEMRVVRSLGGRIIERPMHIGFLTMEPKTLFVPQYLDSSLIIFVRRGEAKLGSIYKDDFVERRLKSGDIYQIPAGSAFYLVNTGEGQRLHIICSIDPSESLGFYTFLSFYIGGGTYPSSVLAGFDTETLATAFNVSGSEVREIMAGQTGGPIVYVTERAPTVWAKFLELKDEDKQEHLKKIVELNQEASHQDQESEGWSSLKKLLGSMFLFGQREENIGKRSSKYPDTYNLYDTTPDFKNDYGWSIALDGSDYEPLKHSGIGVYLVNLTAGSMMAPHVNPTATEYGIVLRGSGRIQIVFPNGTSAMNANVREGDVFWVPRYFPFCQIASRTGPLQFFGFTTSARKNWPQFLVGSNSLLKALSGPELAAAFGTDEEILRGLLDAQREAVILPTAAAAPPDEEERRAEGGEKVARDDLRV